jgi:anti-anti-sigma factor
MNPNVQIIQVSGILDGINGVQLRRTIDEMLKAGSRVILIDCTRVEFMDSSGLGALVVALKQTKLSGGQLSLCGINDQIKMLLDLTHMNKMFEIFPNCEAFKQSV